MGEKKLSGSGEASLAIKIIGDNEWLFLEKWTISMTNHYRQVFRAAEGEVPREIPDTDISITGRIYRSSSFLNRAVGKFVIFRIIFHGKDALLEGGGKLKEVVGSDRREDGTIKLIIDSQKHIECKPLAEALHD